MTKEDTEEYATVLSPTGTQRDAPNTIQTLDAHLGDPKVDHPEYEQPALTETQLSRLADGLASYNAYEESARVEIERRHLSSYSKYAPLLTNYELTRIVVQLVGVKMVSSISDNKDIRKAIVSFAELIDESTDAPLDARYEDIGTDRIQPHQGDYVDPFRVIAGIQTVILTDENGNAYDLTDITDPDNFINIPRWNPD